MRTRTVLVCALIALSAREAQAITFNNDFFVPIGAGGLPTAVSGGSFAGVYFTGSTGHGFLYSGPPGVTVDDPLGAPSQATIAPTEPFGLSGGKVVGEYGAGGGNTHGFLYDGTTYTTLEPQSTNVSAAVGIDGNNVVGYFLEAVMEGFLYNGSTYTILQAPLGTQGTMPRAIQGNTIVGSYYDSADAQHGFIFDGSTYKTLDNPLASGHFGTNLVGISGGNIIGNYNGHGFLYDGSKFTPLDDPLAVNGEGLLSISGDTVLGWYFDSQNSIHPFLATIPEPSTFTLGFVSLAGLGLFVWRRRFSRA